jgi:DNA-binding MarR family transcriptional regulator
MKKDIYKSRDKQNALDRLVAAIRISHNATDAMDEAFAALLGINRTDGRCLDIVQRLGRITAGELAAASGLTTGAVTTVVDRLENAGYLHRTRSSEDRRKVFIELTDTAQSFGDLVYRQMGEIGAEGMYDMSRKNMVFVARFLRTSAFMNRTLSEMLRKYVPPGAPNGAERMRAARDFAACVSREKKSIRQEMTEAWLKKNISGISG